MARFGYSKFNVFPILFLSQFNLIASVPVEPVCSKFSYDEQLLEKMVRMEFFVENLKNDVEKSVSNFDDKLIATQANNSNTFSDQQEKINNLELQTSVFSDTMANKSTVSENTNNLIGMIDNVKKDMEDNVTDLKENVDKLAISLSEQQDIFERKMDVLGETKANKSTVSENIKTMMGVIDNLKKYLENNVTDLKGSDDTLSRRLSEQQNIFERKMDVLGETKANKSTVSENTKTMMGVIDNLKKYLENNVTDLKGSDDTLSRRLSEQQNIFERKMDVLGETKANKSTVSENTKTMMGVIDNLKKYLENNVTDLKGSDDTLSRRLSEQQNIFESKIDVLGDSKANKSTVSEHTKNLVKMKADIENIKKDQDKSTSKVDDLKGFTDEINTKYKGGFSDLTKKLVDLERQVKDLTRKAEQEVVAFNAMDAVIYTGSDAIKFKDVILNEGDAFNKDTGIFTAPVDGIYQFNAHVCGKIEADIEYVIKVESKIILTGEFRVIKNVSGQTKCTSFSAAALVRKGEKVRVGGMPFSKLDREDNDLSSFSGTLIQIL